MIATIQFFHPDLISGMSVFTLLVCIGISMVLASPDFRHTRSRQVMALAACISLLVAVLLIPTLMFPNASLTIGMVIMVGFGFAFGLSALRGPSLAICWIACLINSAVLYLIVSTALGGLFMIATEIWGPSPWLPAMTLIIPAVPALLWFVFSNEIIKRLRSKSLHELRHRLGQCPACAYDLRGTPRGSACPECGAAIDWRAIRLASKAMD